MHSLKTLLNNNTAVDAASLKEKKHSFDVHDFKRKINFLKKIPLFNGLANEHYIGLLDISDEKALPLYDIVIKQGDKSESLFILKKGHLKIYHNDSPQADISAIDIFGEIGFISGAPRLISAIATTECTVIEISRTRFMSFFSNDDTFRNGIILNIINEIAQNPRKYKGIINNLDSSPI